VRSLAWSVTSRTVRPSGYSRHRSCQPLIGRRALPGGRALAAADLVAVGPMTRLVRLTAVIGCSDVVLCGGAVCSHLGRKPPVSRSGVWMDVRDEVVTVSLFATGLSRGG
jgi:hypothetical protein